LLNSFIRQLKKLELHFLAFVLKNIPKNHTFSVDFFLTITGITQVITIPTASIVLNFHKDMEVSPGTIKPANNLIKEPIIPTI